MITWHFASFGANALSHSLRTAHQHVIRKLIYQSEQMEADPSSEHPNDPPNMAEYEFELAGSSIIVAEMSEPIIINIKQTPNIIVSRRVHTVSGGHIVCNTVKAD